MNGKESGQEALTVEQYTDRDQAKPGGIRSPKVSYGGFLEAPKTQKFGPRSGRAWENFSPVCPANLRVCESKRRRSVGAGSREGARGARRTWRRRRSKKGRYGNRVPRSRWCRKSGEADSQCEAVDIGFCKTVRLSTGEWRGAGKGGGGANKRGDCQRFYLAIRWGG